MKFPKWILWGILPVVAVMSAATTVMAIDTSSALYTSNLLYLNLGLTRANFAMAQEISGATLIDDNFMADDALNAVVQEGVNLVAGMPPNNRIVVEGFVVDDGGSATEFTTEAQDATELDVALLPASPQVGDAAYFGCDNPCRIITIDIGQEGIGDWELEWEYYNGTSFVTASNVNDRTNAFKRAGQRAVSFDMPSDFATTTVTGSAVDAYWVRARVDSVSTSSQQAVANQIWYENGQWWAWGRDLSINEEILYTLSMGGPDLVENHQIFPGEAGLITPDDPSIELGDSYIVHWEGAVSFVTGANVSCLVCKGTTPGSAFRLYVSNSITNEVTVEISGAGSTSLSIDGIPEASDLPPGVAPHVIDVVSDGTDVTLTVAGIGTVSGTAQTITDTADDYVWMSNGAATYGNKMYIFPDETGFEASIIDTETEWDSGSLSEVVSTGGQPGLILNNLPESGPDDGYWREGSSTFDNSATTVQLGYSGSGGSTSVNAFFRYDNLLIEQGATIVSATLNIIPFGTNSGTVVNLAINGVDADDSAAPSSFAEAEGLTRTTATVAWSALPTWTTEVPVTSPDITAIVQEIVDRPGWVSGNAMVILVEDDGSSAVANTIRIPATFEADDRAVMLVIELDTGEVFTDDFIELDTVDISGTLDTLEGWTPACSGSSCFVQSTYADTDPQSVFGVSAIRLSGNSGIGNTATYTSDPMPASPGQVWSFSMYGNRQTSGTGCTTSLIARFRDAANVTTGTFATTFPVLINAYQLVEINGATAPANTTNVVVVPTTLCTGSPGSQIYIDGMMAAIAATAPAFGDSSNQLVNPSFEQVLEPTGTWVSPTVNLTATDVLASLIVWDSFAPFTSAITVETSIDGQATWQAATNGGEIVGIEPGDNVNGSTLHVRFTLDSSVNTTTQRVFSPWVSLVATVVADDMTENGADLFYELRTTPGVTIEDLSLNTNDAVMSYPVQLAGIFTDMSPLASTRIPLSQQAAIGAGDFAAPVTGSAANLNLFGQDDGSFLPGGEVLADSAAAAGFPIGAIWAGIVMIVGVAAGAVVYNFTGPNQLPASIVLAGTVSVAAALGDGIIPGWVPFVVIIMLVAWNLLRSRLPI